MQIQRMDSKDRQRKRKLRWWASCARLLDQIQPEEGSDTTMESTNRGWLWVYRKARSYHVTGLQAFYRATRFWLTGDTGSFPTHGGFRKSRIRR